MAQFLQWLLRLPGDYAGADSATLRLAAEYSNWVILGLCLVFAALVALTVVIYLREGDAPRRVKLTIAAFRILVIVAVFAMLCQPVLVLRYKEDLYSTVVVLVDDSLSMSLKDRYASGDLRREVAAALKVGEGQLAEETRLEIVRRLLAGHGGPVAALARDHRLVLLKFSTANPGSENYTRRLAAPIPVATSEEQLPAVAEQVAKAFEALSAQGYETNLAAALRDAADQLQGQRVSGVVLVSDGQATGEADAANRLAAAVAHVRQRGIPVYTVGVGDPEPPSNVEVLQLQAAPEARRGSTVELTAFLSSRNCGGKTTTLRLLRQKAGSDAWTDTGVSQQVQLPGDDAAGRSEPQEVVLRTEVAELGEFVFKVVADALEREFSAADNEAVAKMRVSDEKIKVLLVSGDAGWEFQRLRNLLLTSADRYAVSVWQQDAEKEFNQEASSPTLRLTHLPRDRKELFRYEVVILYDPAYTEGGFDEDFVKLLADFVSEHHGGLCYIASNKHSDMNLTSQGPFDPLAALLPVVLDRRSLNIADRISEVKPAAWQVIPMVVDLDHPLLRLGQTPKESQQIWNILPGVYWSHPVFKLKPLASVLAVSHDPSRRTGDDNRPAPLIAVQYYGKGRSLYIGFDETWRWSAVAEGFFYSRFWQNVTDFLAAGRLQKKRVLITTGGDRFCVGEELRIRAEAYRPDYQPLEDETFPIQMIDTATRAARTVTLGLRTHRRARTGGGAAEPAAKEKGRYEATMILTEVGKFELTARQDDPAYKDEVAGKTITVTLPQEEFRHPEANLVQLRGIASKDAFVLGVHQAGELPRIIPSGKISVFHEKPHDLWDLPAAIVLIVTLLAIEWVLRKRHNMT